MFPTKLLQRKLLKNHTVLCFRKVKASIKRRITGRAVFIWIFTVYINPLNAELNPIRHLLALEGARHIVHVSWIRVKNFMVLLQNISIFTDK